VSTPQPPVVGPTPALRGRPGGPGIGPADGSGISGSNGGGSPWQQSQTVWSESGVAWQRPLADWEPAEAEWERIRAAWTMPRKRRGRSGMDDRAGSGRAGGPLRRLGITARVIAASAAAVTAIAVVAGVAFVAFGGGEPTQKPTHPPPPYPPARLADADFATSSSAAARGIAQSLSAVASDGSTVVAAGSLTGASIGRTQFFVSADAGHTWQLAPVTAPDGREALTSQAPTAIAAGPAGWLAIGPGVSWTSTTGRSWLLSPAPGITPVRSGDRVLAVTATANGFLAAGSAVQHGHGSPVIWTSADGLRWRRYGATQLHLSASGTVGGIVLAAAHGESTVIAGQVGRRVVTGSGRKRRVRHVTRVAMWRSTDGAISWTHMAVPVSNGAANSISGLAPTAAGFVVVRPAASGRAGLTGVIYTSTTGRTWAYAGRITARKRAHPRLVAVSGSDQGAVIATVAGGNLLAYKSASGHGWRPTAGLGSAAAESLAGLTVVAGGNVVAAGTARAQGFLAVAGAHRVMVDLAKIRGDSFPQRALNAMASGAGLAVAVGSANGYPAVWTALPGQPWSRAGTANNAFSRPGAAELVSVTRGPDGWLAVGATLGGQAAHPVVVFSPDGRTWHAADGEPPFAGVNASAAGTAYGVQGYVVVGSRQSGGHTIAAVWRASSLTRQPPLWSAGADVGHGDLDGKDAPRSMSAVTAGPFGYVAVGQHGRHPAIWTSPDGHTWRLTDLPAASGEGSARLRFVAASGNRVVAVGTVRMGDRTAPLAALSTDGGKTWREVGMPVPGVFVDMTGLTSVGSGFAAVGTVGQPGRLDVVVSTSADGAAWTSVAAAGTGLSGPGVQEITALTAAGGRLLGAGFTATETTEDPTLWLAPPRPGATPAASRR